LLVTQVFLNRFDRGNCYCQALIVPKAKKEDRRGESHAGIRSENEPFLFGIKSVQGGDRNRDPALTRQTPDALPSKLTRLANLKTKTKVVLRNKVCWDHYFTKQCYSYPLIHHFFLISTVIFQYPPFHLTQKHAEQFSTVS
jgi:hypothetical protein